MTPFRIYFKTKIHDGKFEEFNDLVPAFIKMVKDTEPQTLQYEIFVNESAREIIWLESYKDNKDFDTHLSNSALEELKSKLMPLQEILAVYFMSAPTEASLSGLQQIGVQPIVLDPWPGTNRLNEGRNEATNIQSFVTISLSDLEAYRNISDQVESAAATQPGILFHRSYQIDNSKVAVFEDYASSDALMAWATVFAENSGNFGSLVQGMTYDVCGTPTASCKEMLDGWGAVYYKKIAGFTRF